MPEQPWSADDIPGQSGRVAIVTGASSGIGLEAARVLAHKGARVIIAARDEAKGQRAVDSILRDHSEAQVELHHLDLADLASVRTFADAFLAREERLDLLINNAGIMMCPFARTSDGFEIQFGTNHLGHFALTGQLLPLLKQNRDSRIVMVSSAAHHRGKLDLADLNWESRKYKTVQAYCDSKLANLLFTLELARKLGEANNTPLVTAAHPGWSRTDLQRHVGIIRWLGYFMGQDQAMGALPTLRAAVDQAAAPGDYFGPGGRREMKGPPVKVEPAASARDSATARELWRISEELTGVQY